MSDGVKGPWTASEIQIRDKLTEMVKLPENSECADCTSKAPRWAVFNHGIFVCIKCSGQHRSLGVGISKVRSINLDRWKPEQFAQMCGNSRANAELLYNLPPDMHKPNEDDDYGREKWIQQKYVKRKWARRDDQAMPGTQPPTVEASSTPIVSHATQAAHPPQACQAPCIAPPTAPPQRLQIPPVPQAQQGSQNDLLDLFTDVAPQQTPMSNQGWGSWQQQQAVSPAPEKASTDPFADLFGTYNAPKQQQQQVQQQTQQQVQQPPGQAGFDITSFVGKGNSNSIDYKPQGFDW